MRQFILFFNAANEWNGRNPNWHRDTPDPLIDEWIVGELCGGYVTEFMIDDTVAVLSHHKDVRDAIAAFTQVVNAELLSTTEH